MNSMRCPKCGAFLEQGKDVCNMCGTNAKTYVAAGSFSNGNSNDGMFGSGRGNGDFSSYNPANNPNYNRMKEDYNNNRNDYKNVELRPVKNGERDIFDFFSENKKIVTVVLFAVILAIIGFAGFKYYQHRNKAIELEPVLQTLYYEVDESFQEITGNNSGKVYIRSGSKGNDCSISVSFGASTSDNHVKEFFTLKKSTLEPEKDASGNVVNELSIYTPVENDTLINKTTWHYLNIFYRKDLNSEPTVLRYRYMSALDKGYFYDIELINNSNDLSCSSALDNFAKSLQFVEAKEDKKNN